MSANWFIQTLVILAVLKRTLSDEINGSTYCEYYNEKTCAKSPEGCPEKEKCVLDHPASRNHCFVTWHFDKATNKTTVKQKGCFLDGKQCYDKTECIDKSDGRRKNIFFCCCSGDMCNKNFAWSPTKPIEAQSALPQLDQLEDKKTALSDIKGSTYCEYYNEKTCANSPEGCPEKEKCVLDHPASRNHCFVTWHFDKATNKTTVKQKGCFLDGKQCYDKTECIDTSDGRRKNIFFCCCSGDMCNKNFAWSPTKPIEAQSALPQLDQVQDKETTIKIPLEIEVKVQETSLKIPLEFEVQVQETSSPQADEAKVQETSNLEQEEMTIIVSLAASLSIGIILGAIYWWINRRNSEKFATAICKPTSRVSLNPYLGPIQLLDIKARGNFGTVWKARMANELVAAKVMSNQQEQSWQTEQDVFKLPHMNHQHLLAFIGVEKREDNLITELWLITAYHEKGSLCNYLKENVLTWPQLCRIAESVLRGLMHLHDEVPGNGTTGFKPAVAHRDLKSQNILLKADMSACIADFGLSLIFHPDKPTGNSHGQVGTRRYMAPEVLQGAMNFNRDSFLRIDMYACALVLWELVTRCMAQDSPVEKYRLPFEAEVGLHPTVDDMLMTVINKGQRPRILDTWRNHPGLNSLCETMEECWDTDPEARLTASCVLERIVAVNGSELKNSATKIWIEDNITICAKEVFEDMRKVRLGK